MTGDVNPPSEGVTLRQAQTALTEQRILAAATELFLADGYVATTLEAVARRARVAARTVYVRFGSKAALFKRVVDVAIVGDAEPVGVLDRDWMIQAMTAPTLAGRIAAGAAIGRQIMQRTGALFAVAQQAAAVEPLIAGFWQEGREQSRHGQEVFWTRLADDGLLPPGIDLTWLIDTASMMAAAETYLLASRMLGWDLDAYQDWLTVTWTRLLTGPAGRRLPSGHGQARQLPPRPHPPSHPRRDPALGKATNRAEHLGDRVHVLRPGVEAAQPAARGRGRDAQLAPIRAEPAPFGAAVTAAVPMTSMASARRGAHHDGSRLWVLPHEPHRARCGRGPRGLPARQPDHPLPGGAGVRARRGVGTGRAIRRFRSG